MTSEGSATSSSSTLSDYQRFIALSRYARWLPEESRRETWEETVDRYCKFFTDKYPEHSELWEATLKPAIKNLEVMPSMRMLMTAGRALEKDNVAGFNCAYLAVDTQIAFDEAMYILMCGTGVGFSVERQYVNKLPSIAEEFHPTETVIQVGDSKIGWATAFRELISLLYSGKIPKWDLSKVRPAGAPLVTFGGRASGPEPLDRLFKFTVKLFTGAVGRKLTSLECHDLMCMVADIVVVGGVRRSALISLSNLSDDRMRHAKDGQWWEAHPHRALANNSVCYTEKPDMMAFMREWQSLMESGSGERGIFFRGAAEVLQPYRRAQSGYKDYGCNPCSEIVLRSKQFCNLTEVVCRPEDTYATLSRKVQIAAILGTFQATVSNFRYLSSAWKENTEEEALLGVSLTGILDCPALIKMREPELRGLRDDARFVNEQFAVKLGIQAAQAVTCVKPSGTVSQLVDSSSGIHARWSPYYIRRVRADVKDPLATLMKDVGFHCEEDVVSPSKYVFSFPMKAPEGAPVQRDRNAIDQLEFWKKFQLGWCEHKPSVTITVKPDEWLKVGAWVYENFDIVSGISFLPFSEHTYAQAPNEEITKEQYEELLEATPKNVDWSLLGNYETDSRAVTAVRDLACVGGACELV